MMLALASVVPPLFPGGPGWHVGARAAHACVGMPAARCVQASGWASTVALRDCVECLPHKTLAVLPPSGIIIQLSNVREGSMHGARASWPPRIRAADVEAGMEGVPRRYGVVQKFIRDGPLERILWIWFGRAKPTPQQLEAANAQLRGVT